MLNGIATRLKQGYRTIKYPDGLPPALPEHFRGLPRINSALCPKDCMKCIQACPTGALQKTDTITCDVGKCLFCTDCSAVCEAGAISFTREYRMAVSQRGDLLLGGETQNLKLAAEMDADIKRVLGRSLKLRQVSAGGCNACEADVNVLGTIGWDLSRFGIDFVASPRHADGLLITGPVTKNMALALKKTYDAVPEPKIVIAVGACAISGGLFCGHQEVENGAEAFFPVDLFIPGCPPNPLTILDGLLRLIGKQLE